MEQLPFYISLVFGLTTALTVFIFYKASGSSKLILLITVGWMTIQAMISQTGFYTKTDSLPPRFILAVLPPLLFILVLFSTKKGKVFIAALDLKMLTLLHIVRIPVELVLLWLFLHKGVPKIMTFEGQNFDILSGLTAIIIWYFVFIKKKAGHTALLIWNFACLVLLINIVATAILAAPFPFQQFGFEQPDVALFYSPFIWLPSVVVPLVLLSHVASIYQLLKRKRRSPSLKFTVSGN
jgi:hypothetical protein